MRVVALACFVSLVQAMLTVPESRQHLVANNTKGSMTMFLARKRLTAACEKACAGAASCASSSCVTECETEAYRCLDKNDPVWLEDRVPKCEAEVVPKYSNTNPECCCYLQLSKKTCKKCDKKAELQAGPAAHNSTMTMMQARKKLTDACEKACAGAAFCASSSCVTECETKAYQCLDKNDPVWLEDRVPKCEAEVVPGFSNTNPECCCYLQLSKKVCKKCEKK